MELEQENKEFKSKAMKRSINREANKENQNINIQ